MNQSLNGLQVDYMQTENNYLVLYKENGICEDELNKIAQKMLLHNDIFGIIPFDLEDIDFQIRFKYNFSGKRILSHYLKGRSIQAKEFYQVFQQIVSIIQNSNRYMLKSDRFILHPDYIFIGERIDELSLLYIPLDFLQDKISIQDELRDLSVFLLGALKESDNQGVYELITSFKEINLSFNELHSKLNVLVEKHEPDGHSYQEEVSLPPTVDRVDNFESKKLFSYFKKLNIPWRSGYWRSRKKGREEPLVSKNTINSVQQSTPSEDDEHQYYHQLADKTSLLSQPDKTVLLQQNAVKDKQSYAYIQKNGEDSQQILISNNPFSIGRGPDGVDLVTQTIGISRVHCEIVKVEDDSYLIKDLNSKNGTYLNKEKLIPYKSYPLQTGDQIQLVGTDYIFTC